MNEGPLMNELSIMIRRCTLLLMLLLVVSACEQPFAGDAELANEVAGETSVVLRFVHYEQDAFGMVSTTTDGAASRAETDIAMLCSRLNIAIFGSDGNKAKTVSQKADDDNFGTVALTLTEGTYSLVAVAHNCDGSATISDVAKVTFPNNKVTDTFYYYGQLEVSGEQQTLDITLRRAVAMFRLVMTDAEVPAAVARFKFYYVGGSSTFSPQAGYGIVQSKQTEYRTYSAGGVYDIYTMPHTEDDVLTKLTVSALDAADNVLYERVFEDIPITRNQVTRYTGLFFGGGATASGSELHLRANPDWDEYNDYNY